MARFPENPFARERHDRMYIAEYIGLGVINLLFVVACIAGLTLFIHHAFFEGERGEELMYLLMVTAPVVLVNMIWDRRISRENALRDELAHAYSIIRALSNEGGSHSDGDDRPAKRPDET